MVIRMQEWFRGKFTDVAPGTSIMFLLFLITTFFFIIGESEPAVVATWIVLIMFSLAIYNYSFNILLPLIYARRYAFIQYAWRIIILIVCAEILAVIVTFLITQDADVVFNIGVFNFVFQMTVTAPVSWFVYRRYRVGKEELSSLKKELGHSAARIDFLRSQINPHFLFNVLNTLYGTALQEKADRTSEGIQRLGDMMRFMLHENMMERISLSREIEYLKNYITLQKLRTDSTATINIEADIPADVPPASISPMLLIPFVENAFKHGISFREPSYIKMVMSVRNEILYFDVSNSIHPKQGNDPEKKENGIGLENVRQRLLLDYPKKHELVVKEGGKDFFVHLTIQLQ